VNRYGSVYLFWNNSIGGEDKRYLNISNPIKQYLTKLGNGVL